MCAIFFMVLFICFSNSLTEYVQLRDIANPVTYKVNERPLSVNKNGEKHAVKVTVRIGISYFHREKENDQNYFTFEAEVIQMWTDSRLTFPDTAINDYVLTSRENVIWLPDLTFVNERHLSLASRTRLTYIYSNGTVQSRIRSNIKAMVIKQGSVTTEMYIRMTSLNYMKDEVMFFWDKDEPIRIEGTIHFYSAFGRGLTLEDIQHGSCNSKGIAQLVRPKHGNFSCLYFHVKEINVHHTVLTVYTPSALCVLLSWASFWMAKGSILGRSLLPVVALIHLISQKVNLLNETLTVDYPVVLNAWIYGCILMVTAALLQTVIVSYLYGSSRERYQMNFSSESPTMHVLQERREDSDSLEESEGQGGRDWNQKKESFLRRWLSSFRPSAADAVNSISKWLFPIVSLILLSVFLIEII